MSIRSLVRAHPLATTVTAAAAPLLCSAALTAVRDSITPATAALALVVVVVLAAATGLRTAGFAAALSAAAWFDFFITEPYRSFAINDQNDLEAAVLLLAIGAVVTEVALWGQRQQAALSRQSGHLDGVLAMAETTALGVHSREEVITGATQRIREVLGVDTCEFAPGSVSPMAPTLQHDGSITRAGRPSNVERDGLPVDTIVLLPVRLGGATLGNFRLTAASRVARPTLAARRAAVLLADQVAAAMVNDKPSPTSNGRR